RPVSRDYHVHSYPVPFIRRTGTADAHLSPEVFSRAFPDFFVKVKNTLAVVRMHVAVDAYNLIQRRAFFFPDVLVPLFDGVSFPVYQVQLGISYFGVVGYQKEEILKIMDTVHR